MNARVRIDNIKNMQEFYRWLRRQTTSVVLRRKTKIFAIKGPMCYICGAKLSHINFECDSNKISVGSFITENGTILTIDHYFPIAIGSKINNLNNLEPCCEPCNKSKGSMIPILPQVDIVNEVICNNSIDLLHTTNSTFLFNKLVNQLK